jgi:hypothetical protein
MVQAPAVEILARVKRCSLLFKSANYATKSFITLVPIAHSNNDIGLRSIS